MRFNRLILSVSALLAIGGCATEPPLPPTPAGEMPVGSYKLGGGDTIRFNVFNEPTLSGQEYKLSSDGTISLPLIGEVMIGGMTMHEAENAITARYADGYLDSPHVNVNVAAFRPFYILGEVNKPGEYPYAPGLTVTNAIATAAGYTYRANRRKIYLRRAGANEEVEVDLTAATPVQPGDTLRIVERYF